MPKIRSVLGACTVETARRSRICHRDRKNHAIPKGVPCLVIKDQAGGHKNYCQECALAILEQAADDLHTLREQLT
jgi:hypothetical protein